MARTSLSGFPEWLPAQRIVEQEVLDVIAETFELHGYASVATRAVEPLEAVVASGVRPGVGHQRVRVLAIEQHLPQQRLVE